MTDILYTNGVIAVKEKQLLGEKLLRFPDMTAQEVLHALTESGFGGGAVDAEGICAAEERLLDAFIREYAPSKAEKVYLLAPYDFHNAKAVCKAEKLGTDAENMLATEGLIKLAEITDAVKDKEYCRLGKELGDAVREALEKPLGGAEIGAVFDAALYNYLASELKHRKLLKTLLARKADMTNILTSLRCASFEQAEGFWVGGGKLGKRELSELFDANTGCEKALTGTPYRQFFELCMKAKEKGMPYTAAERFLESFEAEYFRDRRFELEGKEPFLYYVFRRRAEIRNVRIILVCLHAGLSAQEIKKRLRTL